MMTKLKIYKLLPLLSLISSSPSKAHASEAHNGGVFLVYLNKLKGHITMKKFRSTLFYILMFPAILIGALAMVDYGVPSSIWLQNIVIGIIGTILCFVFLVMRKGKDSSFGKVSHTIIILALLVLPFLSNDLDGVHRWLSIGPINLYIASIILPLLIIAIWKVTNRELYIIGLIFITLIVLLFQPDAGQLTAFAFATVMIVWKKISNKTIKLLSLTLMAVMVALSWYFIDDLAPVPYVEHIIFLVGDMGSIWLVLGVLSLILLLIPFITYRKRLFLYH